MAVRSRSALYRQLFEHWAKAPHGAVEDAYAGKFTGFALNRPKARFIIFRDAEVLATGNDRAAQLDYFSARDILSLFRNPYSNETAALAATEPPGLTPPDWVLLGVEADHPTEHHHPDLPAFYAEQPVYWAVNVAPMCRQPGQEGTAEPLDRLLTQRPSTFSPPRQTGLALSSRESVLFAQATAMIDWNRRNQFCPSCGRHTVSSEAGYKRVCIPTEPAELTATPVAPPCVNSRGVHNSAYPRTDAVAIVCVISPDGQRVLLGRKAAFPKRWYTCVAGFVEPGETLEVSRRPDAVSSAPIAVEV
ncbi:NADH pyrophosphatase [Tieghemiomyces parasiticus]|uniref:NADH pyrophosphatase n=1 Tax=Tieghemiomyces parasiticus TaxID=78921 RepID=A0A9W8AE74_9FUNG|nr:NADH pyrophosphatase [Tieghemiomyces parasiticus]